MISELTRYEAFNLCITRAGGQEQLAAAVGVTQPTVSNRFRLSKQMPAEWVLLCEDLYGVSRHDLRPDIYPRPTMVDQGTPDRFVGIDIRRNERRHLDRRVA